MRQPPYEVSPFHGLLRVLLRGLLRRHPPPANCRQQIAGNKLQAADDRQAAHVRAVAAAKAYAQEGAAQLTHVAVAAPHGRIAAVAGAPLLVAAFAALKLIEQRRIIIVVRFKGAGDLGVLEGNRVVADIVIGDRAVIVPLSLALFDLLEHVEALAVIAVLNIVERRAHVLLIHAFRRALSLLAAIAVAAETAKTAETAEAPRILVLRLLALALTLIHDDLVCLLDFLEFFLISLLVRIAHVGVRMIFAAQLFICFFYLIVCGVAADAQYFIRIHALLCFPLPLTGSFSDFWLWSGRI